MPFGIFKIKKAKKVKQTMKKIVLISLVILGLTTTLKAQLATAQAAYIYTISKYMKWPDDYNSGNFIIGVYSNDPVAAELKKIAKTKKYENRTIEIKIFDNLESISNIHVLYIPNKKTSDIKLVLQKVKNYKTVIIGNNPQAIKFGAGINFITNESELNYEVKSLNIIKNDIQVIKKVELMASKVY